LSALALLAFSPGARGALTIGSSNEAPIVDGTYISTPNEYGDAATTTFQSGGFPVIVYAKHTETDLYICMRGMVIPSAGSRNGPNAAVYIDRINGGGTTAHPDALALSISYSGIVLARRGSGDGYAGPEIPRSEYSVARRTFVEPAEWSAEFRISKAALGGGSWNRPIRIAFAQQWVNRPGDSFGWPEGQFYTVPDSWDTATLTGDFSQGNVNFRALEISATQAIQDGASSVPLISGKRTFARVKVTSSPARSGVRGLLYGARGGMILGSPLYPLNPGGSIVGVPTPNYARMDDYLLFELPPSWTQAGSLTLRAEINPGKNPTETTYSDNSSAATITFVPTNPLRIALLNVVYRMKTGDTFRLVQAADFHMDRFESQVRRMYPISQLNSVRRSLLLTGETPLTRDIANAAAFVNGQLAAHRVIEGAGQRVQVGMVTDEGGFMRGLSSGIGAWETSTPTGSGNFGWDFDGSYGDWYGAHELGHALGRPHVGKIFADIGCGAAWTIFDEPYPYPQAWIGGPGFSQSFVGFDAGDASLGIPRRIYPGTWNDVMAYCNNQWTSDFTYKGIRNYINGHFPAAAGSLAAAPREDKPVARAIGDFLFVSGTIRLEPLAAELNIVSRESSLAEIPPLVPGPYKINLRDAANNNLASYGFTPLSNTEDPGQAIILQAVEFKPDTARIVITTDTGAEIGTLRVSPNAPRVLKVEHNGGFSFPATGLVTVGWEAVDDDRDALTYRLQYSFDNKVSWRTLAAGLAENQVTIDAAGLESTRGSASGYFRVIANDGVNIGSAMSEKFGVAGKAPTIRIANPLNNSSFGYDQQFALEAVAQDFEDGTLQGNSIQWNSDWNGLLGVGPLVVPGLLRPGPHQITVTARDSEGRTASATITINIVDETSATAPANLLVEATPNPMLFSGGVQDPPQTLSIRGFDDKERKWSAVADAAWISLSPESGVTPGEISIQADATGMKPGMTRIGHVTVTVEGANAPISVPVTLRTGGTEAQPVLAIQPTHADGQVGALISWSTDFPLFRLRSTQFPMDGGSWLDWNAPPVIVGAQNTIEIRPIVNPARQYFRLDRK
jgi:hypothetical protein